MHYFNSKLLEWGECGTHFFSTTVTFYRTGPVAIVSTSFFAIGTRC